MFPSLNHSVIPGWRPDSLFSVPTPRGSGPCTKFKSGTEHPHVAALTRKIRMSPSNTELLLRGEQDSHSHLQVAKPSMRRLHGVGDMSASLPAPTSAPEGGATCLVPAHPHKDALGPSHPPYFALCVPSREKCHSQARAWCSQGHIPGLSLRIERQYPYALCCLFSSPHSTP